LIDRVLVLRKLADLDQYLGQIREYADITATQYSTDWKTQRIIERTLQIMIETCVDIAGHIISDGNFRIPTSYADTFKVLHEENILDKKLNEEMERMAKFRNIIVHQYDKVDAEIVINILHENLKDFLSYKNAILSTLKTENET
jgi:uncharacterized protein YutE (UPF0331/DUF86 family)